MAEILFRSKFFEKLFHDSCAYEKKVSGKVDITTTQMDANRRKSIELLLSDDKLSNRAKLALYAGWHITELKWKIYLIMLVIIV